MNLQTSFLMLLPGLQRHASIYFRFIRCPQTKAERIAEAVAMAWLHYCRLAQKGKNANTFPASFASFVCRAAASGRRLCGQEKAKDVLSCRCQKRHAFKVETFHERLSDNTRTPVPDQAAFRIDFSEWMQSLTNRERRLIEAMLSNESTKNLSDRFGVSPARISQLRREFESSWNHFVSDN